MVRPAHSSPPRCRVPRTSGAGLPSRSRTRISTAPAALARWSTQPPPPRASVTPSCRHRASRTEAQACRCPEAARRVRGRPRWTTALPSTPRRWRLRACWESGGGSPRRRVRASRCRKNGDTPTSTPCSTQGRGTYPREGRGRRSRATVPARREGSRSTASGAREHGGRAARGDTSKPSAGRPEVPAPIAWGHVRPIVGEPPPAGPHHPNQNVDRTARFLGSWTTGQRDRIPFVGVDRLVPRPGSRPVDRPVPSLPYRLPGQGGRCEGPPPAGGAQVAAVALVRHPFAGRRPALSIYGNRR